MAGYDSVMVASLTGAQTRDVQAERPDDKLLGRESDKALALLRSLDSTQRQQVILNYHVADLVLGPGQDGKKIAPEGMKVSGMSDKQKAMLLDLIKECAGIMNDGAASARMTQLKAELNNTWFAWSGPTSFKTGTNIAVYYRIARATSRDRKRSARR